MTPTQASDGSTSHSQFQLLAQRRYGPFFLTQLAGAFNDSLLKQITILLVTFHASDYTTLSPGLVATLASGLLILPFVLFSAYAGQLADRFDKARIIRWVKLAEVAIMGLACTGFFLRNLAMLLTAIFAMGCHSAFFGPVKYSILPRVLVKDELTGGNGLLEMGTFLSILGGTLVAGVLVAATTHPAAFSLVLVVVALSGLLSSLFIPPTGEAAPDLQLRFSIVRETLATVRLGRAEGAGVWNSLLAVSWFWFVGAVVLSQIPALGKDLLHGDTTVVTVLLGVFSIGVAVGSLMCDRLSGHQVEIGLVPIGSVGLSLFTADLALSAHAFAERLAGSQALLSWNLFLAQPGSVRMLADVILLGIAGGLYIVPLYAFIQLRTDPARQSRVISANNILNSVFMVVASLMSGVMLAMGCEVTTLILTCAVLNALVALYIYRTVPEFTWRFISWALVHTFYRLEVQGHQNVPEQGPALLVANHVSYVDALVLSAISPRPMRFVMDARIHRTPVLNWLFRQVRAIPIASAKDDPELLARAYAGIAAALAAGELVCIFPEGALTADGELAAFKGGVRHVLDRCPVPVIPVALSGLWGSVFSREPRGVRPGRPIRAVIGTPLPPEIELETLRNTVLAQLR